MRLGVIDIGSNSIKLLVAETGSSLAIHYETSWETRIGATLGSSDQPILSSRAISNACEAVKALIDEAGAYSVERFVIAATSAVRDAANSDEFIEAMRTATGHRLQVLSGEEEAAYIGWGIATDSVLNQYPEFCLADLGGGSLELIHLKDREVVAKVSLPLGAVRLSRQLLEDPNEPMKSVEMRRIIRRVRKTIDESGFHFPKETNILAGTGGGLAVARAIRASWLGQAPNQAGNSLSMAYLRFLYVELAAMTLDERTRIDALSPERADIMPTALLVLLTVAEMAGAASFIFSEHNLRYGIAARYLSDQNDGDAKVTLPSNNGAGKHADITAAQQIAPGE
ncbi:MAG: Ppx/GppA phosphatase family protein [Puniceicoccales bacterium]